MFCRYLPGPDVWTSKRVLTAYQGYASFAAMSFSCAPGTFHTAVHHEPAPRAAAIATSITTTTGNGRAFVRE